MNYSEILESSDYKKILGRFKNSWVQLVKIKNYIISSPKTFEEDEQLKKIEGIEYYKTVIYLPANLNDKFKKIISDIYSIKGIKEIISLNTVRRNVASEITRRLESEDKKTTPKESADTIIGKCFVDCDQYTFYRIVDGLKLEDISIVLGEVKIFNSDETYLSKLLKVDFADLPEYDKRRQLLNKVLICCKVFGDKDIAKTKAIRKLREALNLIRFLICVLYQGRSVNNSLKVNFLAEAYIAEENVFFIDNEDNPNWQFQVTNRILFPFVINPELIKDLYNTDFFTSLLSLVSKNDYSELKQAVLTSIYWIGEAQNDYSLTHTFIKYWSGIEALIYNPPDNKGVTELVENGLATVLTYGGFKLEPSRKIKDFDKQIKDLYDKRSLIVHRGEYEVVTANDIFHVSKMAVYMTLNCLVLCDYGYKKLEDIKKEADRLRAKQRRKN